MSGSYNSFNYNFRPAKAIQRKLILEVLKSQIKTATIKSYKYIGMGSVFFTDFNLFHKELGIKDMVSIESDEPLERFEFNKPFKCIELINGISTSVLPSLNWDKKSIVWLDYDTSLQKYMFEDIEIVFSKLIEGSFFFLTCDRRFEEYFDKSEMKYNLRGFEDCFKDYIHIGITEENLTEEKSPFLIWKMLNHQIQGILTDRNSALGEDEKLIYQQLFFITYKDKAPMLTIGGRLVSKSSLRELKESKIFKLGFISKADQPFNIEVPPLTNKELRLLNGKLPNTKRRFLKYKELQKIPVEHRKKYYYLYRYFPYYAEITSS